MTCELTDVNLRSQQDDSGRRRQPAGDPRRGALRIDQWRTEIVIGRDEECDLVVPDKFASRQHLSIRCGARIST